MTIKDIVIATAKKTGENKQLTQKVVNAAFDIMRETLGKGESLRLYGLGTIGTRLQAEHVSRNPRTGSVIVIPAKRKPVFKPYKRLKQAYNQHLGDR